jgi:putative sigma-54 modulation protein
LDKSQDKENKITEIKLLIPGKTLVAKKQCKTFEEATDLSVEALRKQVKKHKEKEV